MPVAVIRKRPRILSVILILSMVGCFLSLMGSIMPEVKKTGELYPAILGMVVALRFIALVGVWHMKRWGVHFYIYAFLIRISLYVLMGDIGMFGYLQLTFSVIYSIVFLRYYRRMDSNF